MRNWIRDITRFVFNLEKLDSKIFRLLFQRFLKFLYKPACIRKVVRISTSEVTDRINRYKYGIGSLIVSYLFFRPSVCFRCLS